METEKGERKREKKRERERSVFYNVKMHMFEMI